MPQTQKYQITYAGFTVGGAVGRPIEAFMAHRIGAAVSSVDFTFVISDDDKTAFESACASAVAAFRNPRQAFLATNDGVTMLSLSHSSNTGFDSDPHIVKEGQFGDSAFSRFYTIEITFGMPADNLGTGGRRNSDVALSYDEDRIAILTISGVYTATPGASAKANYEDGIEAYCTARLSEYGITYSNLKHESASRGETNKILQFTRVYKQIIFSEAGAALDDPEIQYQALVVGRMDEAPGDSPVENVKRLSTVTCTYDATLNAQFTTDVQGKWAEIKDWVGEQASAVLDGAFAVTKVDVKYFPDTNRISATLTLVGSTSGTVLALRIVVTDKIQDNPNLKPVMNGNRWARMFYPGFPDLTRTKTETRRVVVGDGGDTPPAAPGDPAEDIVADGPTYVQLGPSGGTWRRLSKEASEDVEAPGAGLGGSLVISNRTIVTVWQYYQEFEAVGIAGGDSDPENPAIQ